MKCSNIINFAAFRNFIINESHVIHCLIHDFIYIDILASEVSKFAEKLWTSCSCVIQIVEPQAFAMIDDLKNIVMKINKLEKERNISPWDDEHIPEEIVKSKPNTG